MAEEKRGAAAAASSSKESLLVPWRSLEGKVVLVTGASSGIGRELALDLAKAGCRVVVAARRVDRLTSLCNEINRMGLATPSDQQTGSAVRAAAVELDVSAKGPVVEAAVKRAWDAFGRIDALINNAGVRGTINTPLDLTEDEWERVMAINETGTWQVTKYVCRLMRDANQKGSVISISSIAGLERGQVPGGVAYSVSKGGINIMTKDMAVELGQHHIRVNSISPGIFKSEITGGLMEKKWINKVVTRTVPLKTFGTIDPALTSVVRYLIDDSSEYVSGNVFIVDAGATLPGIPLFSSL